MEMSRATWYRRGAAGKLVHDWDNHDWIGGHLILEPFTNKLIQDIMQQENRQTSLIQLAGAKKGDAWADHGLRKPMTMMIHSPTNVDAPNCKVEKKMFQC